MEGQGLVTAAIDPALMEIALATRGFLPEEEGVALFEAGMRGAAVGPLLEVGSYCGRSTVFLGAAARARDRGLFDRSPPRVRGEPTRRRFPRPRTGRCIRSRRYVAGVPQDDREGGARGRDRSGRGALRDRRPQLADSSRPPFHRRRPFRRAATADYEGWSPHVATGGYLAIHDVFEDPADGGRPPFEIYQRALTSEAFRDAAERGSLRVLERVADGI